MGAWSKSIPKSKSSQSDEWGLSVVQSLLGGFALVHLYMTYLLEATKLPTGGDDSGFLHYYSPMAISVQRTYTVLTSTALLSAVDRFTRDKVVSTHF